jgi:hypothetical protein
MRVAPTDHFAKYSFNWCGWRRVNFFYRASRTKRERVIALYSQVIIRAFTPQLSWDIEVPVRDFQGETFYENAPGTSELL